MTDPQAPAIELVDATKRYGNAVALDHVSLEIAGASPFVSLDRQGAARPRR